MTINLKNQYTNLLRIGYNTCIAVPFPHQIDNPVQGVQAGPGMADNKDYGYDPNAGSTGNINTLREV